LLEGIAEKEGIQVEKDALTLIARQSTGAMRDAISLLDQLASLGQVITLEKTQNVLGTAASQAVLDLIDALIDRAPDKGLDCLHAALDAGSDPRQLARQIVDYLRDLLLVRMEKGELIEATAEMRSLMGRHAQAFPVSALLRVIRLFNQAAGEARGMWQPSLPLEMAFIEALEAPAPTGEAPALPQQPKSSGQRPAPAASGVVPPHSVSQHASSYAQPAVSTGLDPATPPAMLYQTAATRAVVESAAKRQGLPPANRSLETSEKPAQPTREIDQNWQKLLGLTRKYNPKANGLLNSCKSHYLAEDTLILNFASDVISSQMEKPENMAAVQKALNDLYQENMNVRCCVDVTQRDAIPSGAENDGMVAAALRDLGGEVVDIQ
jgi:DNA polymerase-3 subunit gamma/tau